MPELGPAFAWLQRNPAPASPWDEPVPMVKPPEPGSYDPSTDPLAPPPGYDAAFAGITPWESQPPPDIGAAIAAATPPAAPTIQPEQLPPEPATPAPWDAVVPMAKPPEQGVPGVAPVAPWDSTAPGSQPPGPPGFRQKWIDDAPNAQARYLAGEQQASATDADLGKLAGSETFADNPHASSDPLALQADATEAENANYAAMTPEQQAMARSDRAYAAEHQRQTDYLAASEDQRQMLEANIATRQRARAKADADLAAIQQSAQAMADSSPFESWWSSRSTAGKVSGVLATIFAGINNPHGPNNALDAFTQEAEADAAQKWKKLEARRQINGDQSANLETDFRDREAIRQASFEQTARQIEAKAALMDPNGTQYQLAMDAASGVRTQAQQAAMAADKANFERLKAEDESRQAWSKIQQDDRRIDLQERKAAAGGTAKPVGLLGKGAVHTAKEWEAIIPGLKLDQFDPAQQLTVEDVKGISEAQGKIAQTEVEGKRTANLGQQTAFEAKKFALDHAINDLNGPLVQYDKPVEQGGKPVIDPLTGEPQMFVAPGGDAAKAKVSAAIGTVQLLQAIKALRDQASAADVKLPWRDVKQQLSVLGGQLDIITKSGTTGMSSDADAVRLRAAVGSDNLTSFLDQSAKLTTAEATTRNNLNRFLRVEQGYYGPLPDIPNPHAAPPRKPAAGGSLAGKGIPAASANFFHPLTRGPLTAALTPLSGSHGASMSDEQKTDLAASVAAIERGDDDAPQVAANLATAAAMGANPAARAATAKELWRIRNTPGKGQAAAQAAFDGLDHDHQAAFLANVIPANKLVEWVKSHAEELNK